MPKTCSAHTMRGQSEAKTNIIRHIGTQNGHFSTPLVRSNWTMESLFAILESAETTKQQRGNHIDTGHHRHGCVLNNRVRWLCHGNSTAGCRPEGDSRRCESRPINLSFGHPGLVECRALRRNAELPWESLPWRETVNSHATIPAFRISLFAGS